MKTKKWMTMGTIAMGLMFACAVWAGNLTPPGAPAPTMKSLDQVEPRVPLVDGAPGITLTASGQISISKPGSYYLAGNVTIASLVRGIYIQADGVTVDLMGHSIIFNGSDNAGDAIYIAGSNVTVENGHIISTTTHDGSSFASGGFYRGVFASSSHANVTVRNLSVRGVRTQGVALSSHASLVENCTVTLSAGSGIVNAKGIVRNCEVHLCGGAAGVNAHSAQDCRVTAAAHTGISAVIVANCSAESTGTGENDGISAQTVANSTGTTAGRHGISASHSVTGSYGESTNSDSTVQFSGITAGGPVNESKGIAAGGTGIYGYLVSSSFGESSGTDVLSNGIRAWYGIHDSAGKARGSGGGHGLKALTVHNSRGYATTGASNGINASLVTHSYGDRNTSESGRYGISARRAVGCSVFNGEDIDRKWNMYP